MTTSFKKDWSLYIVECRDGSLYTGITKDVARRFDEHCSGRKSAKYFNRSAPKKIRFQAGKLTWSEALRLEHAVKKLSRSEKETLIATPGSRHLKLLLKAKRDTR